MNVGRITINHITGVLFFPNLPTNGIVSRFKISQRIVAGSPTVTDTSLMSSFRDDRTEE